MTGAGPSPYFFRCPAGPRRPVLVGALAREEVVIVRWVVATLAIWTGVVAACAVENPTLTFASVVSTLLAWNILEAVGPRLVGDDR